MPLQGIVDRENEVFSRDRRATFASGPPMSELFVHSHEEFLLMGWSLRKCIPSISSHRKQIVNGRKAPVHATCRLFDTCSIGFRHSHGTAVAGTTIASSPSLVDQLSRHRTLFKDVGPHKRKNRSTIGPWDRVTEHIL